MHSLSHCTTAVCEATAEEAFAFLADPAQVGSWALGCWDALPVGERTVRGRSLFDASPAYVRADPDSARLGVDFAVGSDPDKLVHRISARVIPGPALGYEGRRSLVTLLAWREAGMSDERWSRLVASHEAEILLLRARIEESA
jgi:hypothetical protein